jgi:hypothetical protein
MAPRGTTAALASATARCSKTVRYHVGLRMALMPMARALRDSVCRAGPQPPMDWSMVRLGARAGPTLDSGPAPCACLHLRTSTELSLAGYVRKFKTGSTSGQAQGWRLTRGQFVPLAALSHRVLLARARFRLRRVPHVKPKARRGSHGFQACGRTPLRRVISTTTKSIYQQFKFRAKVGHNLLGMPPCANGHCFASSHYELRGVLRPSGDTNSLHNVSLLRRLRPTACRTLLNWFGNMVLHKFPPGETGRVNLEDSPLFRPSQRQDSDPVAGGVSWIRPVVGISGSLLPGRLWVLGNMVFRPTLATHTFPPAVACTRRIALQHS